MSRHRIISKPDLPSGLSLVRTPVVVATPESLHPYGIALEDPDDAKIEIVQWPATGRRTLDADSGKNAGTVEGMFLNRWRGDVLYGHNEAIDGDYLVGYGSDPKMADETHERTPRKLHLWNASYHPDGGQLFFPQEKKPYAVTLAMPGDDVRPADFVTFRFEGLRGIYIHPNVWHVGPYPLSGSLQFFNRQGAVHAQVTVHFAKEFECLLEVPLSGE